VRCACGSGLAVTGCCGRWHADAPAPTAEALMRSRYSAYVRGDVDYLQATWHADTRPDPALLAPDPATRWLGLEVKRAVEDGDTAVVEFVARFKVGGQPAVRLHETSRFVREDGRWFYVDGAFS
jgi:SEC-C motif-containing protein